MIADRLATHRRSSVILPWLGMALCAMFASGCSYFDLKKNIPWGAGENGESAPPMKVAAVWTDTVLNQAGQTSQRGFGGRLMFYAAEGGKPIKVRGTLVVYAFDETGGDTEQVRPDRKYVFTAEQFEKHYSKSALGHSYSVWLPWDEAGGPRREISLLVRFTPENGVVVIGEASRHNLPGYSENDATQYPTPPAAAPAAALPVPQASMPGVLPNVAAQPLPATMYAPTPQAAHQPVVPVTYQSPLPAAESAAVAAPSEAQRRMSTTTINLPRNVRTRGPMSAGLTIPPSANAVSLDGASYAQLTPLQAAVAAAALQGTAGPGGATNAATTYGHPTAAHSNPAASAVPAGVAVPSTPGAATTSVPPGSPVPSSAHFGPQRLRPLGAPLERLTRDHGPWQPSRWWDPLESTCRHASLSIL